MVLALQGIGVSAGIAIAPASILQRDEFEIPEYVLTRAMIPQEVARYRFALNSAREHLRALRHAIPAHAPAETAAFVDTHLLMLEDATLAVAPIELIKTRQCNAEWALKLQSDALVNVFEEMDEPYLRMRRDDVEHVVRHIQQMLRHQPFHYDGLQEQHFHRRIIVAEDLSPADVALMHQQGVLAFITESGGPTSHTAILARSLGLPTVVGARHARRWLREGETVVVDGADGLLLADVEPGTIAFFRTRRDEQKRRRARLVRLRRARARTLDGRRIALQANIELPRDLSAMARAGADGVGLYRTEFLFMNRSAPPDEEEQYRAYVEVVHALAGAPLTIRTLDLGADKQVDGSAPTGANPALGLRAVRLCLREPGLFLPQLRAILRASAEGPVRLMLPMLTSTTELDQVLAYIDRARTELARRGMPFDPQLSIGAMIEVPAAALSAGSFARRLDFLSIGTNDLIQYTLAIDRIDDEVNYLYNPLHPAVLRLIAMSIRAAGRAGKPIAMCGEMAGDTRFTRLLLGLGLVELSMHPDSIPEVKYIIRNTDARSLAPVMRRLWRATEPERIARIVETLNTLH